jgi:FtsH-binding integral membrane protein
MGNLLRMGLIGVILLSVVNIFLRSGGMEYFICIAGLFIFLGLTAYDTNRIKNMFARVALGLNDPSGASEAINVSPDGTVAGNRAVASNLAIVGALILYLDFINMFLFILRLIGGGRK